MALTSSFGFTNNTDGKAMTSKALGLLTNYGRKSDEPEEAILTNKTCGNDRGELVAIRSRAIPQVNSNLVIQNPAKVLNGVEFGVRLDEVLRTTDESGNIVCDEPIVMTLTVKSPMSSTVSSDIITQVFLRLCGTVYDATADCWRWNDWMKSCLVPTED